MKTLLKNSRKSMAALGAVAVMLVAGWQFGVSGAEAVFSEKELALEKAIAGSGDSIICYSILQGTDGQSVLVHHVRLQLGFLLGITLETNVLHKRVAKPIHIDAVGMNRFE